MKRSYLKPEMQVVYVRAERQLLAASYNNDERRMRVSGLDDDFDYGGEDDGWDAW